MRRMLLVCLLVFISSGLCLSEEKPMFDLSKVAGMELYTGPPEGKKLLAKNGMVITDETALRLCNHYAMSPKQFFASKDTGKPKALPCFITTDTAVRAFFEAFEEGFKKIEYRQAKGLKLLLDALWADLATGKLGDGAVKIKGKPRLGAATFAAVAMKLMNPRWHPETAAGKKLNKQVAKDVTAELKRISDEKIVRNSPLFARDIDYSLCKPRSFYAGNKQLERFYRARTFLAFPMNLENDDVLRVALVLGGFGEFDYLEAPYREMSGCRNLKPARELAFYACISAIIDASKNNTELQAARKKRDMEKVKEIEGKFVVAFFEKVTSGKNLSVIRNALSRFKGAEGGLPVYATAEEGLKDAKNRPTLVAFWPKYATSDSLMMKKLIWPELPGRMLPMGLDVPACCGNDRAKALVLAEASKSAREQLNKEIESVRSIFKPDPDRFAVFNTWMKIFKSLSHPTLTKQHPKFMSTSAYTDKSLNTVMCGWAGWRHTVQLQAEEFSCWGGPMPTPPGYVEPNLEFWDTMIDSALEALEFLRQYDAADKRMFRLIRMCLKARRIADRQLNGKKLTGKQIEWLKNFGETFANTCGTSNGLANSDQSFVATICSERVGQQALHVGLARPRAIYVIIDYGGKLQLARGGVMSYREFWRPIAKGRLTDQQWRTMIKEGKAPKPPKWLAYISAEKPGKKKK